MKGDNKKFKTFEKSIIKLLAIAMISVFFIPTTTAFATSTVMPSTVSNKNVIWKSSNTKVAKVDSDGKVTAVKKGTARITCKAKDGNNKKVTCKVTVTQ